MQRSSSLLMLAICLMLCFFSTVPVMAAEKEQMEMKIGIIGAMKPEVDLLKETMHVTRRETKAGMEFCEGNFGMMRAISDKADDSSSISFEEFTMLAAKNSASLVRFMLEHWYP